MSDIAPRLLAWYEAHGRHDLPWQHPRSPYRVWLAEVMLQQTQVATVIDYFQRFVAALPDLPSLAAADEDTVLALWSGLGYYRRARHLHAAARLCMARHGGKLPQDFEQLLALPGIGRSTAGAILAQACGQAHAILDGNARRVLARHFAVRGWPGKAGVEKQLWQLAEANTPSVQVADYTQAIMDLGATVCTRHKPACDRCPLAGTCRALELGMVAELPERRPRKARPQHQTCMLLVQAGDGRVLLQQRDGHGVWPRLWSLPEAQDRQAAEKLASRYAQLPDAARALAPLQHEFSHYRLHIQPLWWSAAVPRRGVAEDGRLRWVALAATHELGLPAPIRRLLQLLPPPA